MSKKLIFTLSIFIVIIAVVMIFFSRQKEKLITPVSENKPKPTQTTLAKSKSYSDPSGFKFSYPQDLKVTANDISTNNALYTDLVISSPGKKGKFTIIAEDMTKTIFDQLIKDKNTIETKLADIKGFKYLEKNKMITVAYDQGVVFTFTVDLSQEKDYWTKIYKEVLLSFKFVPPETSAETNTGSSGGNEDEVIFEGEEVIE